MAKNDDKWASGGVVNEKPKEEKDHLAETHSHNKHDCYLSALSSDLKDALYSIQTYAKEHGFNGAEIREIFTAGISAAGAASHFSDSTLKKTGATVTHVYNVSINTPDAQTFASKQSQTMIERRVVNAFRPRTDNIEKKELKVSVDDFAKGGILPEGTISII